MDRFSPAAYVDIFSQFHKAYADQLEPVCQKWALTRRQMDVLLFLYNNPEYDRAADIVTRRGIAKSHVSLSVSSLTELGLLEQRRSPADRRSTHLSLTDSGRQIAAEGRRAQEDLLQKIHVGISPEELQVWETINAKICGNILAIGKSCTNP